LIAGGQPATPPSSSADPNPGQWWVFLPRPRGPVRKAKANVVGGPSPRFLRVASPRRGMPSKNFIEFPGLAPMLNQSPAAAAATVSSPGWASAASLSPFPGAAGTGFEGNAAAGCGGPGGQVAELPPAPGSGKETNRQWPRQVGRRRLFRSRPCAGEGENGQGRRQEQPPKAARDAANALAGPQTAFRPPIKYEILETIRNRPGSWWERR